MKYRRRPNPVEMTEQSTVFDSLDFQGPGHDDWYELIVEASADGIWFWDIDKDKVHCTPHLLETLELPVKGKDLNSEKVLACLHPEDRGRHKRLMVAYLKGESDLFEMETRVINRHGEARWTLNRGIARRDENGTAFCMLGSVVDVTARKRLEESLRTVAFSTTEGAGPEFFDSLVKYLSEALGSDIAMIGRLEGAEASHVNTVAVYQDGKPGSNFRYDLAHTPCENVVGDKTCVYSTGVAGLFPSDRMLSEQGIEAYVGAPLLNTAGVPIGILVALFRKPVSEAAHAEHVLRIFASRAAAELERQDKEKALRASEQRFKDFTEIAVDMVWETDAALRFTYFNDQCFERLALCPEDLLGKKPWELSVVAEADEDEWHEYRKVMVKRGDFRGFVLKLRDGHGMHRLMNLSGRPVFHDKDRRFTGYRGVATEITEQRRVQAEYREIFNNATEGIYRSSPEGRFLRVNPALVRMHGFDTEQELMESITDIATDWFVDPQDRTRLTDQLIKKGRVDGFEFQIYKRGTGEKIWVRENAHVVYDDNGDIAYYEGMVYDITEEHHARERSLQRNAVLELIARNAPIAEVLNEILRIAEDQGGYQTAAIFRQRDERLYSTTTPNLKQICLETVDGKTPQEVGGAIWTALTGELEAVDFRIDDNGGSNFTRALRESGYGGGFAAPIRDKKGVVLGALAAFTASKIKIGQAALTALLETANIASIAIEQDRLSQELRKQAHYDPLTELPNRALLADRLDQALKDASRGQYSVGVLMLDLDEFKQINDSLGHGAGDELLQNVAARLRDCLRAGDTVARLGGDEFVVIVPLKSGAGYCTDVAERLIQAVRKKVRISSGEVSMHTSIGIGLYPQDGETSEALLQAADSAMYAAKKGGKNRYCYYSENYYSENMNRQDG